MSMKVLLTAIAFFAGATPVLAQQGQAPAQTQMAPEGQGQRQGPFERADANNDGVITREEVRAARTLAFTRLDANRDGFLVREEMPRPNQDRPQDDRPREGMHGGRLLLRSADANNDGMITKAELNAALARVGPARADTFRERSDALFNQLDSNRDGSISRDEVDAAKGPTYVGRPPQGSNGQGPDGMGPEGEGPPPRQRQGRPNPDTNNDQKVSLVEWLARPDPLFERGDTNNDGRVTREEAAAFMRQMRGPDGNRPRRPW